MFVCSYVLLSFDYPVKTFHNYKSLLMVSFMNVSSYDILDNYFDEYYIIVTFILLFFGCMYFDMHSKIAFTTAFIGTVLIFKHLLSSMNDRMLFHIARLTCRMVTNFSLIRLFFDVLTSNVEV